MKKVWNFLVTMWRPTLLLVAAACLLCALYGFKLGGLTGGMSQPEIQTYESSNSLGDLWNHPVNAPYKAVVYVLQSVSTRVSVLRLASVGVGLVTVAFFYLISRRLLKPMIALGVTAMLASSTLFLQSSRTLSADCMLLGLVFLLWLAFMFRYYRATQTAWIIGSLLIGLTLYTPGIIFFVVAAAIWQQKRIRESFERLQPATIAISTTILFAALLPIVISLFVDPGQWRAYLGFPAHFAPLLDMLKAALYVPVSIIGLSPHDPLHWLGRQPVLDVITSALFVYGLFSLAIRPKLDRLWAILGIFVIGSLWIGISGEHSHIIALAPFVYLCIGLGIQALLQQWFNIFPRNPLARWMASSLMAIAVLFSMNFQLMRYFIAWAHSPDTRALYSYHVQDTPR